MNLLKYLLLRLIWKTVSTKTKFCFVVSTVPEIFIWSFGYKIWAINLWTKTLFSLKYELLVNDKFLSTNL